VYGGVSKGFSILNEILMYWKGKLLLILHHFNMLGAAKGFATVNQICGR
jgi:hypothetical protein